jgi:glutathione synthase/RimK-type ligase-like ATP-grasp enzyme
MITANNNYDEDDDDEADRYGLLMVNSPVNLTLASTFDIPHLLPFRPQPTTIATTTRQSNKTTLENNLQHAVILKNYSHH